MSIEALRSAIEAQGRARVAAALRDGEDEAGTLRSEAARAAARRRRETLEGEEAALRRAAGARIAAARLRAMQEVLEARETLLDRVFAKAAASASETLGSPQARAWLVAAACGALAHMPEGSVTFRCSHEVVAWLEEALAEREGVRVEADLEGAVGFRAIGAGGELVVDGTLERMLELRRPELAIEVIERLDDREPAG
jgi:vacuolar-type H+-ATPase subunit E/Vma4